MSEKLGEAATPLGAPEVAPGPGPDSYFETGRPRLGGLEQPVGFDERQTAVLNAVADTMIPPGEGFPAPSEVDMVDFVGRYVTPSGFKNKHYPFAGEDEFKAGLDRLGQDFVDADTAGRTEAISALEKAEDPLFEQLRSLVYYGYYSMPAVTLAIRKQIPAGRDYHGPPLPYGYLRGLEPWNSETLGGAGQGSGYVATDDVRRVDLSKIDWIKNGAKA